MAKRPLLVEYDVISRYFRFAKAGSVMSQSLGDHDQNKVWTFIYVHVETSYNTGHGKWYIYIIMSLDFI